MLKLVDFGLVREEILVEMMIVEMGIYRWMVLEFYSIVIFWYGEKKYYNYKVDVYSFVIVLWEFLINWMLFEGMFNL